MPFPARKGLVKFWKAGRLMPQRDYSPGHRGESVMPLLISTGPELPSSRVHLAAKVGSGIFSIRRGGLEIRRIFLPFTILPTSRLQSRAPQQESPEVRTILGMPT